jgi:signal transduction histidine kinase
MFRTDQKAAIMTATTAQDSAGKQKIVINDSIRIKAKNGTQKQVVYSINVTDTGHCMPPDIAWKTRLKEDSGNITLRYIRLIVGNATDTARGDMKFSELLPDRADTSLFRKILQQKLENQGYSLGVRITTGSQGNGSDTGKSQIFISERMFEGTVNAGITDFEWLLAKRIFPQFLFSLILLGLTAGAFVFTFRSLKKQIRLNEMRDGFLRNITHELKTPVATVKVALESLRRFDLQSDPRVTEEYLGMASQEMERLDRLIGRVLDISLMEDNQPVVALTNGDLKEIVMRVIASLALRLDQAGATVTTDAKDAGYTCLLEELYVEGVLLNILDNSLKYAAGPPVIDIGLAQDEAGVTLTIRDHGPGIPDEYLGRVFEKFFRVPTGDRHNVKGHGLGLTYVWHVMEQHGGKVEVANLADGGCLFTLHFRKEENKVNSGKTI